MLQRIFSAVTFGVLDSDETAWSGQCRPNKTVPRAESHGRVAGRGAAVAPNKL